MVFFAEVLDESWAVLISVSVLAAEACLVVTRVNQQDKVLAFCTSVLSLSPYSRLVPIIAPTTIPEISKSLCPSIRIVPCSGLLLTGWSSMLSWPLRR